MRLLDAALAMVGRMGARIGLDEVRFTGDDLRRVSVMLTSALLVALLVVDFSRGPSDSLEVGDVAPRTVKAPFTFAFTDHARYEAAREQARQQVPPVFVHRADLVDQRAEAVQRAFAAGREALEGAAAANLDQAGADEVRAAHLLALSAASAAFQEALPVQLPADDVQRLAEAGFTEKAERFARELLDRAMRDRLVVLSREALPADRGPITVIHLRGSELQEETLKDLDALILPERARELVSVAALEAKNGEENDAASAVARAMVTANVSYDPLKTAERQELAAVAVPVEFRQIKRGAILFRAGDVVTDADMAVYTELMSQSERDLVVELAAVVAFLVLLYGSLYHFAVHYLHDLSNRVRNVVAVSALTVLVAAFARLVVASSEGIAALIGYEAEPSSVWYLVPVAGAVMLVRLLMGVAWTVVVTVSCAVVCGLMMDLSALHLAFFLLAGVSSASAVEHTRERIAILKAGLTVGLVQAVAALLIHFVTLFVVESELSLASTMRPVWSMTFAFLGGIVSAFLVLGLVPLFELAGFVTDYRLMELANLNHPLLRQLMLRAPGSYHHSVVVGTLAEAGAEAIGANSLVSKVASYFHDVGKALKPQYFVENQRDGVSRHNDLDPYASARIIISHVVDGARMAREHNLPQPILDNILMHHGTGILQFFYARAQEIAVEHGEDPDAVDPDAFRYPGPKPSTREAGVIMLADKVEAATRTLAQPTEENIRAMISRIVNSVVADGQFSECPLTFEEIHTLAETFVSVLLGIYHQRIEYPQTADLSRAGDPTPAGLPRRQGAPKRTSITLDLAPVGATQPAQNRPQPTSPSVPPMAVPPLAPSDPEEEPADYEAVDYLPRGD